MSRPCVPRFPHCAPWVRSNARNGFGMIAMASVSCTNFAFRHHQRQPRKRPSLRCRRRSTGQFAGQASAVGSSPAMHSTRHLLEDCFICGLFRLARLSDCALRGSCGSAASTSFNQSLMLQPRPALTALKAPSAAILW